MTSWPVRVLARMPRWVMVPVLVGQGLRVRRTTPRLPEAVRRIGRVGESPARRLVVVLGDSVAVGVGIGEHTESMAGWLAVGLAAQCDEPVAWRVLGQGGLTAAGVRDHVYASVVASADLVVISVGVNDAKGFHGVDRWRRELAGLLDDVLAAAPRADVALLAIPPMEHFATLPVPLSWVLGGRARALDLAAVDVVAARPRVRRVEPEVELADAEFAADGFHPGVLLHRVFAEQVLAGSPLTDGSPPTMRQ